MPDGYRIPEDEKPRPKAFRPDLRSERLVSNHVEGIEAPARQHITDDSPCWCGPQIAHVPAEDSVAPVDHLITDVTSHSEDTLFKAATAAQVYTDPETANDIINEMLNAGILFRERVPAQEEHTHYTVRANRLCAEGDHDSAVMWDRDAERVKVREAEEKSAEFEEVMVTMAEEPIEDRLRRAWLNGFKDGVDRASFAATESTVRWDY